MDSTLFDFGGSALQAYLRGNYKPLARKGMKAAINYGLENSGWDWALNSGGSFTPMGQGVASGLGTLAAGLVTGDTKGLAGKAATSAVGSYAGNALGQAAVQNAGMAAGSAVAKALTGAVGAGVGGVASGLYEAATQHNVSTGTQWSTIGGLAGSIFGPVGTVAGRMIGNLAAGFLGADKPKVESLGLYKGGSALTWDEKAGRFVPSEVMDAKVTVNGKEQNLKPGQKNALLKKVTGNAGKLAEDANSAMGRLAPSRGEYDTGRYTRQRQALIDTLTTSSVPKGQRTDGTIQSVPEGSGWDVDAQMVHKFANTMGGDNRKKLDAFGAMLGQDYGDMFREEDKLNELRRVASESKPGQYIGGRATEDQPGRNYKNPGLLDKIPGIKQPFQGFQNYPNPTITT